MSKKNVFVGNIVPNKRNDDPKIIACKCDNCGAIFTIKFQNRLEYQETKDYYGDCPVCEHYRNWLKLEIPIPLYKWIRWIRSLKKEE